MTCGRVKTLLYARRMRMRLFEGFRLGTPIIFYLSFSLSS